MVEECDYLAEISGFHKSSGVTLRCQWAKIVGGLKGEERKHRTQ